MIIREQSIQSENKRERERVWGGEREGGYERDRREEKREKTTLVKRDMTMLSIMADSSVGLVLNTL